MNNRIQSPASSGIYYEYNLFIAYYTDNLNVGGCILPTSISPALQCWWGALVLLGLDARMVCSMNG